MLSTCGTRTSYTRYENLTASTGVAVRGLSAWPGRHVAERVPMPPTVALAMRAARAPATGHRQRRSAALRCFARADRQRSALALRALHHRTRRRCGCWLVRKPDKEAVPVPVVAVVALALKAPKRRHKAHRPRRQAPVLREFAPPAQRCLLVTKPLEQPQQRSRTMRQLAASGALDPARGVDQVKEGAPSQATPHGRLHVHCSGVRTPPPPPS